VMAEASAVTPEGRISPWCPGLWDDEQAQAWKAVVDEVHRHGAHAGIQLAHAGRKGSTYRPWSGRGSVPPADGGWDSVAPSAVEFPGLPAPRALEGSEIASIPDAFAAAARRALTAGFDVVEVHAAHGYLLHEFLSPLSNHRTDSWGGSRENRARLLLAVIRAVRDEVGPAVPVFVRLSATDWAEPEGWQLSDTTEVAVWAREAGADLIDVSSGGMTPGVHITTGPGYQVPFAQAVRDVTGEPVAAVGEITEASQANIIITSEQADAVMVGRQFLRDPHFALRCAAQLGAEIDYWPVQYLRGQW